MVGAKESELSFKIIWSVKMVEDSVKDREDMKITSLSDSKPFKLEPIFGNVVVFFNKYDSGRCERDMQRP